MKTDKLNAIHTRQDFDESKELTRCETDHFLASGKVLRIVEDYLTGENISYTMKYKWPSGRQGIGEHELVAVSYDDQPAVVVKNPCGSVRYLWCAANGYTHREGKPAVIEMDEKGNVAHAYYRNGKLSRPEGGQTVEHIKAKPLQGLQL